MEIEVGRDIRIFGSAPQGLPLRWEGPGLASASLGDYWLLRDRIPFDWPPHPQHVRKHVPVHYGSRTLHMWQEQFLTHGPSPRILLADETGLGKTIEGLSYARYHDLPTLVVARASAQGVWRQEADAMEISNHVSWTMDEAMQRHEEFVSIVNYDQIGKLNRGEIADRPLVILDEAHAIKERTTHRSLDCLRLFEDTPHKIVITATPVRNHTKDLWPLLAFLDRERFGDWHTFATRYCEPTRKRFGEREVTEYDGTSNWEELMLRLKSIYVRRTVEEVGLSLPPRTRTPVPVNLSNLPEVEAKEKELREKIRQLYAIHRYWERIPMQDRGEMAGLTTQLHQLASMGKVGMVADWAAARDRTLIFSRFSEPLHALSNEIGGTLIEGSIRGKKRDEALTAWKAHGGHLLITTGTGSESLNLFETDCVAFIDMEWSPATQFSAERRVLRQGQTRPVHILYFVGTKYDQKVAKRNVEKMDASPDLQETAGDLREALEALL